jgi:sugar phosphate isomerase/epimerase
MKQSRVREHPCSGDLSSAERQWPVEIGCDYGHTMLDLDDLTMSLAGLRDDPCTCRAGDLERMIAASAAAGFRGLSLWSMHADMAAADGLDRKALGRLCDEHGVQVRVVEALSAWPSGDRAHIEAEARPLFELATELGAEEALAVSLADDRLDLEVAARGLAYTCDLAARHGLGIVLEFLPWTNVPDLGTAWAVLSSAARDNAGLVIDSWHWQRQPGGPDFDTLRSIPGDRIRLLQLNDAPVDAEGDLVDETMNRRLLPGEGEIDLRGLVDAIDDMGGEPIVAPEVFSRAVSALGPEEAAERMARATRDVLSR